MQSATEDRERLIGEVERYLGAVDAFRGEGCEPSWRRESPPRPSVRKPRTASAGSRATSRGER